MLRGDARVRYLKNLQCRAPLNKSRDVFRSAVFPRLTEDDRRSGNMHETIVYADLLWK